MHYLPINQSTPSHFFFSSCLLRSESVAYHPINAENNADRKRALDEISQTLLSPSLSYLNSLLPYVWTSDVIWVFSVLFTWNLCKRDGKTNVTEHRRASSLSTELHRTMKTLFIVTLTFVRKRHREVFFSPSITSSSVGRKVDLQSINRLMCAKGRHRMKQVYCIGVALL